MTTSKPSFIDRLKRAAAFFEVAALLLCLLALGYRATLYWLLPASDGSDPGLAAVLDFSLAMLLFVVCLVCAGIGVLISLQGEPSDRRFAYRAFFIGVLSFLLYEILYQHVPRLL